ncbi:NAD(P)-binding domain containing protein [Parasponia andersonii]|uniref:NAD(P)-binding domain containing protein n=1 Tax=Parasponia andersonii TaxID=3476 RepID=A0A2P5DLU9_PARAD|nr:NAD(P)-binding domain containing protein [Parasponia andersonii]
MDTSTSPVTFIDNDPQPTLNFSVKMILKHINGTLIRARFPDIVYRFVDVRDIALGHIQAFEVPSANGGYCLFDVKMTNLYSQATKYQRRKLKVREFNFTPLEATLGDTVESLKEKSFLKI